MTHLSWGGGAVNIGLLPVDSRIPNLALMRLSAWHKAQGDTTEIASPLWGRYDRVYRSKQFDFTPDDTVPWPCEVISGGTGYDLTTLLTPEQDTTYPDYDLFGCDFAIGRLTRGCVRRCPWCVVWRQDGTVRQVAELSDFWRGQERLRLMDDNLAALPDLFVHACGVFAAAGVQVKFEAMDVRLLTDDMCRALLSVRRWGRMHFAWDSMRDEVAVLGGLRRLQRLYPSLHDVAVYVLIGYDTTPEEDLYRAETLRALGVDAFVMPYDRADVYQRKFARWVNQKALFKATPWEAFME